MREIRASVIGALTKIQQCLLRRLRQPNIVIHQKELVLLGAIERLGGLHSTVLETGGFWCGISVECCVLNDLSIARPKSHADYLVRVTLFRNDVGIRTSRCTSTREACRRQIKAPPKEMYGTCFSDEPRSKLLKDRGHSCEDLPKAMRVFAVVRRMTLIEFEGNRSRDFNGRPRHLHVNAERVQRVHEFFVEGGHGARRQTERSAFPEAGLYFQSMVDKVKVNLEDPLLVWYR